MTSVPDWDRYFLEICRVVAARSKDPSTKVGCVIVGPAHEIRSTGYNSLPRHIRDDQPERFERPAKYLWVEHAERNAIYNAARAGTPLEGCSLYADLMPCMDCARGIVQAGIVEVVVDETRFEQYSGPMYSEQFAKVVELFAEAGVRIRKVPTAAVPAAEPAK